MGREVITGRKIFFLKGTSKCTKKPFSHVKRSDGKWLEISMPASQDAIQMEALIVSLLCSSYHCSNWQIWNLSAAAYLD